MAMTQQEFEQWIEQQGGPKRVQYKRSTQKVANPAKQRTLPDGSDNPDWDPTAPATIEISEETWVAVDTDGKPTGAELHARRRPDGELDIVNQQNPNPARGSGQETAPPGGKPYIDDGPEAGQAGRRWGWNPATKAYDRNLGPSPAAQKPTTGTARKPVTGKPGVYEVTTKDDATNTTETHYEDEQGNRVPTPTEEGSAEAPVSGRPGWVQVTTKSGTATKVQFRGPDGKIVDTLPAEPEKPKPVQAPGGQWGYWDTSQGQPKWVPIAGGPADSQKPVQVEGQWGVWQPGEGGVPTWKPIEGPKAPTVDIPAMRLEAGKISEELKALWEDLNGRVRRGEITREQAKAEFEGRHAIAAARLGEIKQTVDTQQSIYHDQLTQRSQDLQETQSRRGAATSASNAATDWLQSVAGKPGGGKADYSAAADEIIDRAYRTQQRYGATRESPAVQVGPAAAAANALPLPGLPSPTVPMATAGAATSELGQPGAPTLAENAAAAQRPPVIPAFRPQPPVNMTPPAVPGAPSPLGDTGAPPVGADQGDSMGAASKILTPTASAGGGSPMMARSMAGSDTTPPAMASLLEMELPGGIKVRVPSSGGMQQSSSQPAGQQMQDGGGDDQSDRIKRMRDIAPDDPNWQRSLDEQERQYGRPSPQSLFAA